MAAMDTPNERHACVHCGCFDRDRETGRRQGAVMTLIALGYSWNGHFWVNPPLPEVVAFSTPRGPSWVQQRFLDAPTKISPNREKPKTVVTPLQCGKCERTIETDPLTGTKCECTPVVRQPRVGSFDDLIALKRINGREAAKLEFGTLPQSVQQTQRSESEWPGTTVDNIAIRQCMYRAEADFHRGSKAFLTKREQGHIMGLFRNVVAAFVATITKPQE